MDPFTGKTIALCSVEEHFGVNDPEAYLIGVSLRWTDTAEPATIACGSDGETLQVQPEPPAPFDMAESGRVAVRTTGPICDLLLPGRTIVRTTPMVTLEASSIGIKLELDDGTTVYIYNWGDDLTVTSLLPQSVRDELANSA